MTRTLDPHIWPADKDTAERHGLAGHLHEGDEAKVHAHLDLYDAFAAAWHEHEKHAERWRKAFHEHATLQKKHAHRPLPGHDLRRMHFVAYELKGLTAAMNRAEEVKDEAQHKLFESHEKIHPLVARIHGDRAVHPRKVHQKLLEEHHKRHGGERKANVVSLQHHKARIAEAKKEALRRAHHKPAEEERPTPVPKRRKKK